MADNLTQQEIIDAIKAEVSKIKASGNGSIALRSDASALEIAADAAKIRSKSELKTYLNTGILPTHGFTETALAQLDGMPRGAASMQVLGGGVFTGAAGAIKSVANLGKAVFAKKAAEEGVKQAAKMSLKKKAAIAGVTVYAGSKAAGSIGNAVAGNKSDTTANQSQSEIDMANAVAAADAAGLDVNSIINTPAGQQLNLSSNNLPAFMAKFGLGTTGLTGVGNVGIFTGTETHGTKLGPKGISYPTTKSEIVSLADWNKKFPADAKGLADIKQKFLNAGLSFSSDPGKAFDEIKSTWTALGKTSLDYSRAGSKLSPWQILDMQRGLSGGGSQSSTTIDTSPIAEADIRTLTKSQLAKSLGLSAVDDKTFKDILSIVRKNEAKRPTKSVRTTTGNTTRVNTTPGYGQSDVLADVEAYAKQDPRYADFQTADVFGNALTRALGLKS
jgi:hypothetical protein